MHPPATRRHALALIRAGHNDCEVSRRTGLPRTTIRDWRRPVYVPRTNPQRGGETCPRCGRASRRMSFTDADYALLLGLYLGDGYIVAQGRSYRLRIYLDSRYPGIVRETRSLLRRCFPRNQVGTSARHGGRLTVHSVYSTHLPCVFPQHGAGTKRTRAITLESWQQGVVDRAPWQLLRGLIESDGCSFVNRTGPYEYLSYHFSNKSQDILDLFCGTCDQVGVEHRRYADCVRINRRASVAALKDRIGVKR